MTDRHDYDAIEAMNWSSLKRMHESALEYDFRRAKREDDKPCWTLGRAAHCAVLEPESFDERYVCAPREFPDTKGVMKPTTMALKSAKEWFSAQTVGGREGMKEEEYGAALSIGARVHDHAHARRLLTGGRAEVTVRWTDAATGLACKARLDYLRPTMLVDLKSTRDCGPRSFASDAARYLYHGQVAWYLDGAIAARMLPPDAETWIVAVESEPPHDVACYSVEGIDLEAGRALYRSLLELYEECTAAKWWPGKVPDPRPLSLPGWAPGMREAEQMGAPAMSSAWDYLMAARKAAANE